MSLKRSLILAFAGLLTVLGILSATFAYISASSEAWDMMDAQQNQIARFAANGPLLQTPVNALPGFEAEDDFVVDIADKNSGAHFRSHSGVTLPNEIIGGFSAFTDTNGEWRLYTLVTEARIVRVAQPVAARNDIAADSALGATLPFLFAIPVSWLLITALVAAVIRRLTIVADTVNQKTPGDTTPIATDDAPLEIRPLINAVNGALARQQSALEQQSDFLANAAHELRTPLAAIGLQIGNLKRVAKEPVVIERIKELESGAKRAAALTDQLLRLARQETSGSKASNEIVSLNETLSAVIAGLQPLANERRIDLALPLLQPFKTRGYQADIHVALETLLDNAIRYSQAGSKVEVTIQQQKNQVVLTVTDNGPGISEDDLPHIFERFYRAAGQEEPGSGLGLAIAKMIADRNGFSISLENRQNNQGLQAKLIFPALILP